MSHVSVTTEAIRPTIITARGAGSGMNRFRYADRYSILSGPEMGVTGYMKSEDIQRARADLNNKIVRDQRGGLDITVLVILMDVLGTFERLLKKMDTDEEKYHVIEESSAKDKAEFKAFRDQQSGNLRKHADTITTLWQLTNILNAAALNFRPASHAMRLQRMLDDVRFCIADGFMELFPRFFTRDEVLNEFDSTRKSVYWRAFKRCLANIYNEHHQVVEHRNKFTLEQSLSVFHYLGPDEDDETQGVIPNPKLLAHSRGAGLKCDEDGWPSHIETNEELIVHELRFFIPALIWGYNRTRKDLLVAHKRICEARKKFETLQALGLEMLGEDIQGNQDEAPQVQGINVANVFKPVGFAAGTALDVRTKWRNFVLSNRKDPGSRENLKRKSDEAPEARGNRPRLGSPSSGVAGSQYSGRARRQIPAQSVGYGKHHTGGRVHHVDSGSSSDSRVRSTSPSSSLSTSSATPDKNVESKPTFWTDQALDDDTKTLLKESMKNQWKAYLKALVGRQESYKALATTFNKLRKCLQVLLDDKVLAMATRGDLILQRAGMRVANESVDVIKGQSPELLEVMDVIMEMPDTDAPHADNNADYNEELQKVKSILYDGDNYYETGKTDVERIIDQFIAHKMGDYTEADKDNAGTNVTDYHVLLQWLDSLEPVEEPK